MAQMGFAHSANSFGAQHTVGAVDPFFDGGVVAGLGETGPAATGIKLGVGREQLVIATHAPVHAFVPVRFIATGERAFGGGMAGDFVGHRFGIFGCKVGPPFGTVFG